MFAPVMCTGMQNSFRSFKGGGNPLSAPTVGITLSLNSAASRGWREVDFYEIFTMDRNANDFRSRPSLDESTVDAW